MSGASFYNNYEDKYFDLGFKINPVVLSEKMNGCNLVAKQTKPQSNPVGDERKAK